MAHSYVAAALAKYDALTAALFPGATRPRAFFGKAAAVASGAQVRPPFVVLEDEGARPVSQSDGGGPETGTFTLTAYANTLADVDAIVAAIKWNGSPPASKAGFDHGSLTLDAPLYHLGLVREREARSYDGDDKDVKRVHKCVLTYRVEQAIDPAAAPA